jgi:hypothetical protein
VLAAIGILFALRIVADTAYTVASPVIVMKNLPDGTGETHKEN